MAAIAISAPRSPCYTRPSGTTNASLNCTRMQVLRPRFIRVWRQCMKRAWDADEVIEHWTLSLDELAFLSVLAICLIRRHANLSVDTQRRPFTKQRSVRLAASSTGGKARYDQCLAALHTPSIHRSSVGCRPDTLPPAWSVLEPEGNDKGTFMLRSRILAQYE